VTAFLEFLTSREALYADREVLRIDGVPRTYPQLLADAFALAAGLAEIGVGTEDHIAMMMDTSHESVDVWFASSLLGSLEIPLNAKYRGDLLGYLLRDSEATIVICDSTHLRTILETDLSQTRVRTVVVNSTDGSPAAGDRYALSELYQHGASPPASPSDAGTTVLYTSGTTGPSKGVMHTQRSCLALGEYVARVCRYTPEDALLNFFPLYHQNARYTGVITAIAAGCRLNLDSKLSTSEFWSNCRDAGITAFNYLGSVLHMIMAGSTHLDPDEARDHPVRKAYGAGAPRGIWNEFEQRFGVELFEAYGLTEAPMAAINVPPRVSPIGSAGRASDLFELQILDERGEPAAPSEVGEIVVRPKVPHAFMLGYYNREADTVRLTRNLWFHTGDRGLLSDEGDLYFEERAKDSIRRRGVNISAWEVESVLDKHPAVLESAVYAIPTAEFDEEVMAAIVPARPDADLEQIVLDSATDLPPYAVPRYVRALDELPRTGTLKVQKSELRQEGVTEDTLDLASAPVVSHPAE
jgi:crotonobetaine/carnitine-CoA ligase